MLTAQDKRALTPVFTTSLRVKIFHHGIESNHATLQELVKEKAIEYIPFPDTLKGKYQCFTQADLTKLRASGYTEPFLNVEQGVGKYIEWLEANAGFLANPL